MGFKKRHLFIALFAFLALVLMVEGLCRLALKSAQKEGIVQPRDLYEFDLSYGWHLKPLFKAPGVWINSRGLRDEELSIEKQDGVKRVVALGDSVTYGWRVKQEDTYPYQLRKMLPQGFEVVNGGIPGYSTQQGYEFLEEEILPLQPDIIIIMFGWNDQALTMTTPDQKKKEHPLALKLNFFLNRHCATYKVLKLALFSIREVMIQNSPEQEVPSRVSLKTFKENMEKMIDLALSHSISVFLATEPEGQPVRESNAIKRHREYNQVIREVAREKGVTLIDIERVFEDHDKKQLFDSPDENLVHPNSLGNHIIAEEMKKSLLPPMKIEEREEM